jgi:IS5 family transposase
MDLSEKNKVVYRDKGYFGAKSKNYNATMKRSLKEHPTGMSDGLRNKEINSKKLKWNEFMQ